MGLSERIEFHHGLSFDEIVNLYARASIAVVPSEYEGFGFPLVRPWLARCHWFPPTVARCPKWSAMPV